MTNAGCFSINTSNYLKCFQEILDEMICRMTSVQPTDSISHTFIVQMIPHHMAAIEMSRNLLNYTTCIPLQEIAVGIIDAQTKSIEDMQRADPTCQGLGNSPQSVCAYLRRFEKIANTMFADMGNARPSNNINVSFMREMIPHHLGAVRMSQNALSYNICLDLTPILRSIITSQEKGIREMERLLCRISENGC